MKRAALWVRATARRTDLSGGRNLTTPGQGNPGAFSGSPGTSSGLRCTQQGSNTVLKPHSALHPRAHSTASPGGTSPPCPHPPAANLQPPGGGAPSFGGLPQSSNCSSCGAGGSQSGGQGYSRQAGKTFASRPSLLDNPGLLTAFSVSAFIAGLGLGRMSHPNELQSSTIQSPIDGWRFPSWPLNAFTAQALSAEPAALTQLSPHFIADAADKAAPAVVNIMVQTNGFAFSGAHSGSGFIVDTDGTILTNAHVISEMLPGAGDRMTEGAATAGPIICTLHDGRIFEGTLTGYDRVSDLAIIKIDCEVPLPAVRLGSSKRLRAGEWVVALGSPLHLNNSITAGIISSVERKAAELGLASSRTDYIQTDAAINTGNSGGPLINLQGEVVAICNMKALAADGVSFAIPIDAAKEVVAALSAHGRVIRPYIGIKMLQLTPSVAAQLRRRDPGFCATSGILVPLVTPGSPAERAGIKPGDVIIGTGEVTDVTIAALSCILEAHIDKLLSLKVLRPTGEVHTLQVTASEALS